MNSPTFMFSRLEGAVTDLTPGDNVKAGVIGWSHDASSFFLYTNERDAARLWMCIATTPPIIPETAFILIPKGLISGSGQR